MIGGTRYYTATTSDNDYVAKSGTLTFAPGETTKTIATDVKGESKKEANKYFYLDLFGNSSNSLFTKNRHRHDSERRLKCNRFLPPADAMTTRGRCAPSHVE